MVDKMKCCNGDCRQGKDCPMRKEQMWADAVVLLVMFVLFLVAVAGFFDVLWR